MCVCVCVCVCRHSLKVKIRGDRERYKEELQQRELDDRRIEEILVICLTHTLSQRRITLSHTPAPWFMGVPCIQRYLNSRPGSLALLISVCLCVCFYMSVCLCLCLCLCVCEWRPHRAFDLLRLKHQMSYSPPSIIQICPRFKTSLQPQLFVCRENERHSVYSYLTLNLLM